ncbi:MAG: hypothetical protein AMXMBFR53_09290 [Gemmatimonadota bacterium]
MSPYLIIVSLHVLAAITWLGGIFFFAMVGAPTLRNIDPPSLRARLFAAFGQRFRLVGWCALTILVLTGLMNLGQKGLLDSSVLASRLFWQSDLGQALAWKLSTVMVMLVLSAAHDFVLGPHSARLSAGSIEADRARRRAAWAARLNALVGTLVVLAAVRLARGG